MFLGGFEEVVGKDRQFDILHFLYLYLFDLNLLFLEEVSQAESLMGDKNDVGLLLQ